jgi:hypothetical protein
VWANNNIQVAQSPGAVACARLKVRLPSTTLALVGVVSLFLFLSVIIRGATPRVLNEYLSDITIMRASQGDFWSILAADRSPVINYSVPYGSWPPLHTIIQFTLFGVGLPIDTARLMTGLLACLLCATLTAVLLRRLTEIDPVLVFLTVLISPVVTFFSWHGVSHVLIPLAAVGGLWLVHAGIREKPWTMLWLFFGAVLIGLTDWFAYGILPSCVIAACWVNMDRRRWFRIEPLRIWRIVAALVLGLLTAFVLHKMCENYVAHRPEVLFSAGGLGEAKLLNRMLPTLPKVILAAFYTTMRGGLVIVPMLMALRCAGYKFKPISQNNSELKLLTFIAMLSPLCFAFAFTGQVSPANHRMQCLSFVVPGVFCCATLMQTVNSNLCSRLRVAIPLFLLAIYGLQGFRIVPSWLLKQPGLPTLEFPLPPGNYEVATPARGLSLKDFIRTMNNQIMTTPGTSPRMAELNPYHKSWADISLYGHAIKAATGPDEIIAGFGELPPGFSFYTERIGRGIANLASLHSFIYSVRGKPVILLIPQDSSLSPLSFEGWQNPYRAKVSKVPGTPYSFVRFAVDN